MKYRLHWGVGSIVTSLAMARVDAQQWPQFRGPTGDGVSKAMSHPSEWSEERNVQWKLKVEGVAWSQPIIWGDKVFVTTAVAEGQPAPQIGESGPGFSFFSAEGLSRALAGGTAPDIECSWKLICFDVVTGARLWAKDVQVGKPVIPIHRSNSYASETPVCDGQRVYLQVAMTGVYCLDLDGNEIWNQPLPARKMQYGWGTGTSLSLYEDTLFVLCDNEQESYLAAFNKQTGDERWRVSREEASNWSTPTIWENAERVELITCGGKKTRSYDPATGDLVWELPAEGRAAATAVGNKDLLFVGSVTRSQGSSGALVAVRAGATGTLSSESDHVAWTRPKTAPELASPLLAGDYLYALRQQGGIITCLAAATGKQHFRERLPKAGGFTASPWLAGGHVFCLDEKGQTFVIEPGPALTLVTTNKLAGMFWSSPAIIDGALLLRSADYLYRISAGE